MSDSIRTELSLEETLEISNLIASHDLIFQTFWSIGTPLFTTKINTAAVGFDRSGKVLYLILNPDFWDSLDIVNKAFVICHEALHVVLNHGKRGLEYTDQQMVNKAQDIVINEMLIKSFDFNKFEIINWDKYCFVETMFSNEQIISEKIVTTGSFYYYMDLLIKHPENVDKQTTVDQHQKSEDINESSDQEEQNYIDDLIQSAQDFMDEITVEIKEEIENKISEQEKYDFGQKIRIDFKNDPKDSGCTPLGSLIEVNPNPQKKTKKWEEIVKKHLKSGIKYESVDVDSWITNKRSHSCLGNDFMLEGTWQQQKAIKEKYNVIFFLDSSGSCLQHAKRFVKMLKSIPEDKFNIEAYSFDSSIYPIDIKIGKVLGGGGTYFSILDTKIRQITKDKKHPDAIFVLSDGDGDTFNPEKPKLWHWILTANHSLRYIPKLSPKHKMNNFD